MKRLRTIHLYRPCRLEVRRNCHFHSGNDRNGNNSNRRWRSNSKLNHTIAVSLQLHVCHLHPAVRSAKTTIPCVISSLTLFTVIAVSRPVNNNVNTVAVKPGPHCRRKVRLSPKTARQRRQSTNSATVALFFGSRCFCRRNRRL